MGWFGDNKVPVGDKRYEVMLLEPAFTPTGQTPPQFIFTGTNYVGLHNPTAGPGDVLAQQLIEACQKHHCAKVMDWNGKVVMADAMSTPEEVLAMLQQGIPSVEAAIDHFDGLRAQQKQPGADTRPVAGPHTAAVIKESFSAPTKGREPGHVG